MLRLLDYRDFNSQHSNLNLVVSHLVLATACRRAQRHSGYLPALGERARYSEWVAFSFNNTYIRWTHRRPSTSESGSSGVRETSFVNSTNNPTFSAVVKHTYKAIYGKDVVIYELVKGDDQFGATTGWLEAVRLSRLMNWCGFVGQEGKVLTGPGWSEYLRCMSDETGSLSGCLNRGIAVMEVGSWQKSVVRDSPNTLLVTTCYNATELMVNGVMRCWLHCTTRKCKRQRSSSALGLALNVLILLISRVDYNTDASKLTS